MEADSSPIIDDQVSTSSTCLSSSKKRSSSPSSTEKPETLPIQQIYDRIHITSLYQKVERSKSNTDYENIKKERNENDAQDKVQRAIYRKLEIIDQGRPPLDPDDPEPNFKIAKIQDFDDPVDDPWKKIGRGHYSDVYVANFQKRLHAIKVIKRSDRSQIETHIAVDQEAEVLIYLRHPNTLKLTGVYLPADDPPADIKDIFKNGIIITPYFGKGDVVHYCGVLNKKKEYLSYDIIVQWCYQLASALAYRM